MITILLIGSYNGQDSFGDKGLLRSVAAQFRRLCGTNVRFVSHVFNNIDEARRIDPEIEFHLGIQEIFWAWHNKLRHLRLPFGAHLTFTLLTSPLWFIASAENRRRLREFWRDIRSCSLLYFYGGTQLSEQWFNFNFPPLALAIVSARLLGKRVFFGPQQYGPHSTRQRWWLRLFLKWFVDDLRVRNTACATSLQIPQHKLVFDEIYSCTVRYPVYAQRRSRPEFILANMRGSNFWRDSNTQEFIAFVRLLKCLSERSGLPVKLFQMSGGTFCNDTVVMQHLSEAGANNLVLEVVEPFTEEQELIDLAGRALGTVSMSFHGCVLSMLAGTPAVPITSGEYYDHKYADFSRYAGGQAVPILRLSDPPEKSASFVLAYFDQYSPRRAADARSQAAAQVESWYEAIVSGAAASVPR